MRCLQLFRKRTETGCIKEGGSTAAVLPHITFAWESGLMLGEENGTWNDTAFKNEAGCRENSSCAR